MADRRSRGKAIAHENQNVMTFVPGLPDPAITKILTRLPTKLAIRICFLSKSWLGMWRDLPLIDLQEEANNNGDEFQHTRFTNFLLSYLERRDQATLDMVRLHMIMHETNDVNVAQMLLNFAAIRSARELDLNLRSLIGSFWRNHSLNITCAESVSVLRLEHVNVEDNEDGISFPLLKSIFLNQVRFERRSFMMTLSRSPRVEHVFVDSFNLLTNDRVLSFRNPTLRSLEVGRFEHKIEVTAINLESFTLGVENSETEEVKLERCPNLRHVNIHARRLDRLVVFRCHESVKASIIITQALGSFSFRGHMKHNVFEERLENLSQGEVAIMDRPTNETKYAHFSALCDFLEKGFGSCYGAHGRLTLYVLGHPKAWTFPKYFKDLISSIFKSS